MNLANAGGGAVKMGAMMGGSTISHRILGVSTFILTCLQPWE